MFSGSKVLHMFEVFFKKLHGVNWIECVRVFYENLQIIFYCYAFT